MKRRQDVALHEVRMTDTRSDTTNWIDELIRLLETQEAVVRELAGMAPEQAAGLGNLEAGAAGHGFSPHAVTNTEDDGLAAVTDGLVCFLGRIWRRKARLYGETHVGVARGIGVDHGLVAGQSCRYRDFL